LIALSACLPKDDNKDIIIINVTKGADYEWFKFLYTTSKKMGKSR
jgi:hypothetical protein